MTPATGYVALNERPHGGHEKLVALVGRDVRVLDIGCSSGYLARRLVHQGCSVVGIEMDEEAAEVARAVCEEVLVGDVETMALPFQPASFDVVLCGDTIEHLRGPRSVLENIRPLLRPDGRLILTTPNVANWAIRLGLLFGRWQYTDRGILDRTHLHLFTRRTLAEMLEAAGFRVTSFDFTMPVPHVGSPHIEGVAHSIGRLRPSLFAYQFVVAATPA